MTGKINFITGINGSGKSTLLGEIAKKKVTEGKTVLAVINTPYHKIPKILNSNYKKILISKDRNYVIDSIEDLFFNHKKQLEKISTLSRSFNASGFSSTLHYEVSIDFDEEKFIRLKRKNISEAKSYRHFNEALASIDELFEHINIKNKGSIREYLKIEMSNISSLFSIANSKILKIVKYHKQLENAGFVVNRKLLVEKKGIIFNLNLASSGELTKLITNIFIGKNIKENSCLLFEEPENSLHPKWQSELVSEILDSHHYYNPEIYISTHSPLIISGTISNENGSANIIDAYEKKEFLATSKNIEDILIKVFKIITPQNHKLSQIISEKLNKIESKELSLNEYKYFVLDLLRLSYDENQKEFLMKTISLAEKL